MRTAVKNILLFIFIFIIVFSIIIIEPIGDLDEIWNYNTARAISEGLIPYKDVSMITTPLLPMVTAIFLNLISNELIISRILAALLWTGILFTIYKIFMTLLKEENISLIFTAIIGWICRDIYCIDYNVAVLFFALLILYKELHASKQDLLIGLLAGLAVCTKQSIGVTLAFVVVLYKLLFVENKEQFKEYIKTALKRIVGILIPVIVFIIYLLVTGAMSEFINYAVLGISTFSNKIPYVELLQNDNIEIVVLSILVPIAILIMAIILIVTKVIKKENTYIPKILTMFIYSLSIIIVMYPISDSIHFLIGGLIAVVSLLSMVGLVIRWIYGKLKFKRKYLIFKSVSLIIWLLIFVAISRFGLNNLYNYAKVEKNTEIEHFKYIEVSEGLKTRINQLDNYIKEQEEQGKKVYILDAEAAVYMIPIDKYNKDYDMFLIGNIGKDGEQGQIDRISKKSENEIYLIRNEKLSLNWQTPKEVLNYIRNNLEKVDEVSIYEVYR